MESVSLSSKGPAFSPALVASVAAGAGIVLLTTTNSLAASIVGVALAFFGSIAAIVLTSIDYFSSKWHQQESEKAEARRWAEINKPVREVVLGSSLKFVIGYGLLASFAVLFAEVLKAQGSLNN